VLQTHIRTAAFAILSTALATTAAAAQGLHNGVGGAPAVRAAPVPHISAAPHFSAPHIVAPQVSVPHLAPGLSAPRALSVPHAVPQQFSHRPAEQSLGPITRHTQTPQIMIEPREEGRALGERDRTRSGRDIVRRGEPADRGRNAPPPGADEVQQSPDATRATATRVLRNPFFAKRPPAAGEGVAQMVARSTFHGRFFDRRRRHHDGHPVVIGWAGPLFWPYAFDDLVDYTFYPYAYDTFWPYAYEDLYDGMFGRYGLDSGSAYASEGGSGVGGGGAATADLCTGRIAGLTDWPTARIAQAVEPDDAQRKALDVLKGATAVALDKLKAACPTALPSTPTGRLAAVRQRLEAMLQAVRTVRPALEAFYRSLNDEQKARFDAVSDDTGARQASRDLSQACGERASGIASVPIEQVEAVVTPDETQRNVLTELRDAIAHAADLLKSDCPTYRPLTPVVRLQTIEQRLDSTLQAVQAVEPALDKFYGSLSDEQKERFNRLTAHRA
jgi:ABC-type transporter MlaC component